MKKLVLIITLAASANTLPHESYVMNAIQAAPEFFNNGMKNAYKILPEESQELIEKAAKQIGIEASALKSLFLQGNSQFKAFLDEHPELTLTLCIATFLYTIKQTSDDLDKLNQELAENKISKKQFNHKNFMIFCKFIIRPVLVTSYLFMK